MTRVAVAGGTGLVGAKVAAALRERGDDVAVLSRTDGVDILNGAGLAHALRDVEVIVDVTSTTARKTQECVDFFGGIARQLQAAGAAAGVHRIVTLSIVGIDGLDGGGAYAHYAGKLAQEREARAGAVPSVILRATQFHEFAGQMIDWTAMGPVVAVPKHPAQTVALTTVVEHLVRLVDADMDGDDVTVNLAGPQRRLLRDLVKATAKARGQRLAVVPVWLPGETPRRVRNGALQAPADAIIDGPGFDDWLANGGRGEGPP